MAKKFIKKTKEFKWEEAKGKGYLFVQGKNDFQRLDGKQAIKGGAGGKSLHGRIYTDNFNLQTPLRPRAQQFYPVWSLPGVLDGAV